MYCSIANKLHYTSTATIYVKAGELIQPIMSSISHNKIMRLVITSLRDSHTCKHKHTQRYPYKSNLENQV